MTPSRYLIGLVLLVGLSLGQSYLLKASVLDGGGKGLSSVGYRCGLSVGQQAASGLISSTGYDAVLGFWHNPYGGGLPGIEESQSPALAAPLAFSLARSYPNPFSRRATIRYSLAQETEVSLTVIDLSGRVVRTLVHGRQKAGAYKATWDLTRVPSRCLPNGVYFCRLVAGEFQATQKMLKLE